MGEKILVTGGSGFIGSEVVAIALSRGYDVRILDLKPPRRPEHMPLYRYADIREADAIEREILDYAPDRLLHLASDIDVTIKTLEGFKSIIDGTANVLRAVKRLPNLKRFIHTSTQFVVMPGIEPEDEHHLEPYTIYGEAKAEAEKLVWKAELSAPWFILRPTIIWGPHHPSFAQHIFKHIASRRYLHPKGREPITRAFGYVTNVADQMMSFATIDPRATNRRVFYLGDDSIDYDIWADAFARGLTGKPARRIPIGLFKLIGTAGDIVKAVGLPSPIDSGRVFRMSTASRVDLSPTHALVGKPKVSFDQGVAETLDWLKTALPRP